MASNFDSGPGSVLIIDDNLAMRRALRAFLESRYGSVQVIEAGDASSGERAFSAQAPDVVLLDLELPDGSGLDLLPRLKRAAPGTAVVIVTSTAEAACRELAMSGGADGYVEKIEVYGRLGAEIEKARVRAARGGLVGSMSAVQEAQGGRASVVPAERRDAAFLRALLQVATEVEAPEAAIAEGLRLVCKFGRWRLGHAIVFAPESQRRVTAASVWHADDSARYAGFIALADAHDYSQLSWGFLGRVVSEQRPLWVADLESVVSGPRTSALHSAGIRCGFAAPVTAGGEVLGLLEFFTDVERNPDAVFLECVEPAMRCFARMVERQRAASAHARLAAIVEGANDAIIGRTLGGIITSWNPAAERLLGYTAAEAVGQPITLTIPGTYHPLVARHTERLRRGEPIAPVESVGLDKDGRRVHVSISVSPVCDTAGKVNGAAVIVRDITETVLARQWLRAILESEPACVKVVDAQCNILEMNRAGLKFLDAESLDEVRRHGLPSMIAPEHRARFRDSLRRTLDGENCDIEFELIGLKGTRRWVESHSTPFQPDENMPVAMLSVTRDITDRKRAEERATHLANHDALTGLPNRNLFRDRVGMAIAHARRRAEAVGVVMVDIDRFHKVNESLGFEGGDELLRLVATRLAGTLREVDTLARLGSDAFAILVEAIAAPEDMVPVVSKIDLVLAAPFSVRGQDVFVNASVGVAVYPPHADTPQALIECAELAMNRIKQDGGAGCYYSEGLRSHATPAHVSIEAALRNALAAGELEVHYQPKIDIATRRICGAEALMRWKSASLGRVSPATFIPIAEETGLIVSLGAWVLEQACAGAAAWRAAGHEVAISVNLSPRQFRQKDLVESVARALESSRLPPHCLELEITEGTAMANAQSAVHILRELRALGVMLSVDDFGTGYSSLNYLHQFPLDCLKIDRSFVHAIESESGEAIVSATIALGHSLRLKVVAEGVETEAQHARLAAMGCDHGQGFLYSAAVPAATLERMLAG